VDLRDLARRLSRVRLVSAERDLIERLDRLSVASGELRYSATSAPDVPAAETLVERLAKAAPELEHGLRLVDDDRPSLLRRGCGLVARALELLPEPLPLAFSWRRGERAPPRRIERVKLGPILGYPACCVRFEEARRARVVRAEARGMLETWHPASVSDVVAFIVEQRPYLAEDVGDDMGRVARLRRFPFVSYVPCPRCCQRGATGAAGRDDARRRELARRVSPRLEVEIERLRGGSRRSRP